MTIKRCVRCLKEFESNGYKNQKKLCDPCLPLRRKEYRVNYKGMGKKVSISICPICCMPLSKIGAKAHKACYSKYVSRNTKLAKEDSEQMRKVFGWDEVSVLL